ncbi:hypothetical protein GCK72_008760 [Caenorhabditis remanei]|uniref:F-box domain-containing protein n=1 Tax=Caenorhabditis remanei TaxID=31234 RepID=A0A6A5H0H0_CAERE|nr:hypothetical protein GCK72_008760 [Caenorhabditis remanei]KAF1760511.1 hypothetical protein GCK72_008760 [Caenorhabditis remanei]
MSSKFPLLKLPTLVFNTVVANFNVFELVSLALCSKSSKSQCKQYRSQTKLKKQIENFHVEFSTVCEVRIKFYPSLTSELMFYVEKLENEEEMSSYSQIFDNMYIPNGWRPRMNDIAHDDWFPFKQPFISEFSQVLYYSNDTLSAVSSWIAFLSDLFTSQPSLFCINFDCFHKGNIDRIMSLPFPIARFVMKHNNDGIEIDEELVVSILKRQNATKELKLEFKPSERFHFDFASLQNAPDQLEIDYSHWSLVEKWKNGWTPKWKRIMIEFCETLDVDSYISDPIIDVTESGCGRRDLITRNIAIYAYKFQHEFSYGIGNILKNGYHLTREDRSIATITVENNKIGWFIIHNDTDQEFIVYSNKRTFCLN